MTSPSPNPDVSPFQLDGGPVGTLLIHGFMASPKEMRLIGEYLHARGLTIAAPLLPGHGTSVQDLNRHRWTHWSQHISQCYKELRDRCSQTFVVGQSLGALLTLQLASDIQDLTGAIVCAPPLKVHTDWRRHVLPIIKYLIHDLPVPEPHFADPQARARLWIYDRLPLKATHSVLQCASVVRQKLHQVTCPLLVIHSESDRTIHPESIHLIETRVGSSIKERVTLQHSGHSLPVDSEWETVAEQTFTFISSHSTTPPSFAHSDGVGSE